MHAKPCQVSFSATSTAVWLSFNHFLQTKENHQFRKIVQARERTRQQEFKTTGIQALPPKYEKQKPLALYQFCH